MVTGLPSKCYFYIISYIILTSGKGNAPIRASHDAKTLAEKRKAIPAVDLLVGAVNVWCWDKAVDAWCRELQALGIRRILWSNALPPDPIKDLNDMGVLTSRYDICQDAMNPENFPRLRGVHSDWTSDV